MPPAARTLLTLTALGAVLVVAAWSGWSILTSPLPDAGESPTCVETPVRAGEELRVAQVTVTVLNAGRRSGLANRTLTGLVDQGFHRGGSGNAGAGVEVSNAQIWTDDPDSPAVALVAARIPGVRIVPRDATQFAGVVLVVGNGFAGLRPGPPSVTVRKDTTICAPPLG